MCRRKSKTMCGGNFFPVHGVADVHTDQAVANYGLWAQSLLLPIFVCM